MKGDDTSSAIAEQTSDNQLRAGSIFPNDYRLTWKYLLPDTASVYEPSLSPVLVQVMGALRLVVHSNVPPLIQVMVTLLPDRKRLLIWGGGWVAAPSVMRTLSMARISFHQVERTRNSTIRSVALVGIL